MPTDASAQVEVVIFFRAPTVHRTAIMTAVPRIEDHGVHRLEIRDLFRTHQRIDRLGQIHARNVVLPPKVEHGKGKPVLYAVDPRLTRIFPELNASLFRTQHQPAIATHCQAHLVE